MKVIVIILPSFFLFFLYYGLFIMKLIIALDESLLTSQVVNNKKSIKTIDEMSDLHFLMVVLRFSPAAPTNPSLDLRKKK